MWYIKSEYVDKVRQCESFEDVMETIKRLLKEGNAVTIPLRKSNLSLIYGMELINQGYEFIYLDLEYGYGKI